MRGHGLLAVLAQAVPLLDRDVSRDERQDLALLEVEVLEQGLRELLDHPGQLLTADRGGVGLPLGDERADLVGVLVDAVVLGLHGLDEPRGGRGTFEEQRPEELVLARVVHVQAAEHEPQVAGDDCGPG